MDHTSIKRLRELLFTEGEVVKKNTIPMALTFSKIKLAMDWSNAHILWFGEEEGELNMVAYLEENSNHGKDEMQVAFVRCFVTAKEAAKFYQEAVYATDLAVHVEEDDERTQPPSGVLAMMFGYN